MGKPKVYVTRRVPSEGMDILRGKCDVDIHDDDEVVPRAKLLQQVQGVNGLFCTINDQIDAELLDAAGPELRVVATMSVGKDHIDCKECNKRGIFVAATPDVASDSAAELTVALILTTCRRILEGTEALKSGTSGHWKPMWNLGNVCLGKTLGIFGFGRVGFGVARRMKPFGVSSIIYTDVEDICFARDLATRVCFDELLKESDILVVTCAVTPQTIGIFDIDAFAKMKNTAFLINTSRGAIVNQDHLYKALTTGMIQAAGLDVTIPEPLPPDHELMQLKNCTIFPHLGTNTIEARRCMSINTAKNILAVLK